MSKPQSPTDELFGWLDEHKYTIIGVSIMLSVAWFSLSGETAKNDALIQGYGGSEGWSKIIKVDYIPNSWRNYQQITLANGIVCNVGTENVTIGMNAHFKSVDQTCDSVRVAEVQPLKLWTAADGVPFTWRLYDSNYSLLNQGAFLCPIVRECFQNPDGSKNYSQSGFEGCEQLFKETMQTVILAFPADSANGKALTKLMDDYSNHKIYPEGDAFTDGDWGESTLSYAGIRLQVVRGMTFEGEKQKCTG